MAVYILNGNNISANSASEKLSQYGRVIRVPSCPGLPEPEMYHADMRLCKISDRRLVCPPFDYESGLASELESAGLCVIPGRINPEGAYPRNIPYNVLRAGNLSFHNTKYTDPLLKELLSEEPLNIIHVNQGYAGCSSIAVPLSRRCDGGDGILIISSDMGIVSAVRKSAVQGIYAEYFTGTDNIVLDGYGHGFIGGCCGFDVRLGLLVCGEIDSELMDLSCRYEFRITQLCGGPLTDIGGILVM